jgi:hypothetical protein
MAFTNNNYSHHIVPYLKREQVNKKTLFDDFLYLRNLSSSMAIYTDLKSDLDILI